MLKRYNQGSETRPWGGRVVATECGPKGRALRTSSAGMHDEACEAVRRTRALGEAEAKQARTKEQRKIPRMRAPKGATAYRTPSDWSQGVACPATAGTVPEGTNQTPGRVCGRLRLCRCPKGAAASREGSGINASGDAEAKASGVKVDQNCTDLRIEIANSENSSKQRGPRRRIRVSNSVPCNPFNASTF
jgi:hypothetical protein